jgi:hypothetical protein
VPLLEAANHVVPVAVTASDAVTRLRRWASGRCLSASEPGIYLWDHPSAESARRVTRPASDN